jgi:NADH:ubiquinone oxidoreductase subunit 4 (subunit M)
MTPLAYPVVALFLPLFPISMLFNRLYARLGNPWLRMCILLVWPQAGLLVLAALPGQPPDWVIYWAVLTACLYAFRAVALRDLNLWTAHMVTSTWALLWAVVLLAPSDSLLVLQAGLLSVPFILLAWLASRIEALCGAAYAGSCGGLAQTAPRLSVLLVFSILAAVGTPLFPAFFTLLATIVHVLPALPGAALTMLIVWLLWAWSGVQMTRGLVVGAAAVEPKPDLDLAATVPAGILLAVLVAAGVTSLGYLA